MSDLTSNLILQTESPPGNLAGFQQALAAIQQIDKALKELGASPVVVDIRVNDNVIQQAKLAGQQISQALTTGGQQAAGLSQGINAATDSLIRQRQILDGTGQILNTQVDTYQKIAGGIRTTTDITRKLNEETGDFVKTSRTVTTDLRNNAEAIRASAAAQERFNKGQADTAQRNARVAAASKVGFQPVLEENGANVGDRKGLIVLKRQLNETTDEVLKLDAATGVLKNRFNEINTDRLRAAKDDSVAVDRAQRAVALSTQAVTDGFRKVSERTKITADGTEQLVSVYTKLKNSPINQLFDTQAVSIRELNSVTGTLTERTLEGAAAGRFIGDSFLTAARKVALWTATTGAIFGAIQLFKEAAQATIDLERNTVFLARVGNGFASSVEGQVAGAKDLTNQLVELSTRYGVSATEAQQAAAIFARSGLTVEQTAKATTAAIIASKIAELGLVEAARLLSAAQSQFNLSADDLLPTLDRLNALSNSYRVTTSDLLQSISRSGAVFADFGGSLEELSATTAVLAQDTARAGGEIGNAIKTIVSNLQRSDIASKLLEKTGVVFREDGEQASNFAESLAVLQQQFAKLTNSQQANLSIGIAGVRQRNLFVNSVKDAVQIAIAEVKALQQSKSATTELKLESTTLAASLARLQAEIFKVGNSAGSLDAFKAIIDILSTIIGFTAPLSGLIIRFAAFIALFAGLKFIVGLIAKLFEFQKIVAFVTVAIQDLKAAMAALTLTTGGIAAIALAASIAIVTLASSYNAYADGVRNAQVAQQKKLEAEREAVGNAGKLALANKALLRIFEAQVAELGELERLLAGTRPRVPTRNEANVPSDPLIATRTAENQQRAAALIESLGDTASAFGKTKEQINNYAQAQKILTETQKKLGDSTDEDIKKQEQLRAKESANIDATRDRKKALEETEKALIKVRETVKSGEILQDIPIPLTNPDIIQEVIKHKIRESLGDSSEAVKRFNEALRDTPYLKTATGAGALDDALAKITKDFDENTQSAIASSGSLKDIGKVLGELNIKSERFKLAERVRSTIEDVKNLRKEIQSLADANQLIRPLEGLLNIDKSLARQRELNELLEFDLQLQQKINSLLRDNKRDQAKEFSKENLVPLRKQELELRTEKARNTLEQLSKFFKTVMEDAFNLSTNVTRRTIIADRKFFEVGEDLEQLEVLGAAFHHTEQAAADAFGAIIGDAALLKERLKDLSETQNQAASDVLQRAIKARTGRFADVPLIQSTEARRKHLESITKNSRIFTDDEARAVINRAKEAAGKVPIDESTQALLVKIQAEREQRSKRLNELADLQLKIAEELIGKEKEITAEMRQQTNEQIKQLGLLGEEDKLRVLAQAGFFKRNPNFQVTAEQQFFAPAEDNRILQEFFAPHRAKEFDPNSQLGKLLLDSNFGNERFRQLQGAQVDIARRRQEFVGKDKNGNDIFPTDDAILEEAANRVRRFRQEAVLAIEKDLEDFLKKVQQQNLSVQGLPGGGPAINNGRVVANVQINPFFDEEKQKQLVEGFRELIDVVTSEAFVKLRNQLFEVRRQIFELDFDVENPPKSIHPATGQGVPPRSVPPAPGQEVPPPPPAADGSHLRLPDPNAPPVSRPAKSSSETLGSVRLPDGFMGVLAQEGEAPAPTAEKPSLLYKFKDDVGHQTRIIVGPDPTGIPPGLKAEMQHETQPGPASESGMRIFGSRPEYKGSEESLLTRLRPDLANQRRLVVARPFLHPSLRGRGIGKQFLPIALHSFGEFNNAPTNTLMAWDSVMSLRHLASIKSAVSKGWLRPEILNYVNSEGFTEQTILSFLTRSGQLHAQEIFMGAMPGAASANPLALPLGGGSSGLGTAGTGSVGLNRPSTTTDPFGLGGKFESREFRMVISDVEAAKHAAKQPGGALETVPISGLETRRFGGSVGAAQAPARAASTPTTTKIVGGLKGVGKNLGKANEALAAAQAAHAALTDPEHFDEWVLAQLQGAAEGVADLSHAVGDYSDSSSRQMTGKDSNLNIFRKVGDLFDFFAGRKFRGGGGELKDGGQWAVPPENIGAHGLNEKQRGMNLEEHIILRKRDADISRKLRAAGLPVDDRDRRMQDPKKLEAAAEILRQAAGFPDRLAAMRVAIAAAQNQPRNPHLQPSIDFALEAASQDRNQAGGGPASAGIAGRSPASAGIGRSPLSAGIALRAPSAAIVPNRKPPIPQLLARRPLTPEDIENRAVAQRGLVENTRGVIEDIKKGKIDLPRDTSLATQEGLDRTYAVLQRAREGKVELSNGQFADPAALKRTQDRIDAINKRDAASTDKTDAVIEAIHANNPAPFAPLGFIQREANDPTTSPDSPLGRVNAARRGIYEQRQRETREAYQQAQKDRRTAYLSRGERFYQQQLERMGLSGGASGVGNATLHVPYGNIPGVPGDQSGLPGVMKSGPLEVPGGGQPNAAAQPGQISGFDNSYDNATPRVESGPELHDPDKWLMFNHGQRWSTAKERGLDYSDKANESISYDTSTRPKTEPAAVSVNPQVDWGPVMASFEQTFSTSIVNSFTRAMPQIVQLIATGLANMPARAPQTQSMDRR